MAVEKERFGVLGLRIVETRFANIRLFLKIWDSEDGTIACEGMQETHYSHAQSPEKAVTLRTVVEYTAGNLIARLP